VAIASMTGFSRMEGALDGFVWVWEIKSVNGRTLDLRCRLPAGFEPLDAFLRAATAERLKRGSLSINLSVGDSAAKGALKVDRMTLAQIMALLPAIDAEAKQAGVMLAPPRLDGLLALRGVLDLELPMLAPAVLEQRQRALQESFLAALEELDSMRLAEGARLGTLIEDHLAEIARLCAAAGREAAAQPQAIAARLAQQFEELLPAARAIDPGRLAQEAAILATKADVREEIDRLGAHVEAARAQLAVGGAVGRKLDFLCQEFNREANTLCSKAADLALTSLGIALKASIEQLREQIQNIE